MKTVKPPFFLKNVELRTDFRRQNRFKDVLGGFGVFVNPPQNLLNSVFRGPFVDARRCAQTSKKIKFRKSILKTQELDSCVFPLRAK